MQSTILSLVVALALVAALVGLVAHLYRTKRKSTKLLVPISVGSTATDRMPLQIIVNPLKDLSFEDSLQPDKISEATRRNVASAILSNYGADTTSATLQIAAASRGCLQVTFGKQAYQLVRNNKTGKYIAESRLPNGSFGEIAHVDKFGTWLNNLSHASAAVVAVAHIISNADISKRLGEVQLNTTKLLEYRERDILADIKTTFQALREELGRVEPRPDEIATHRKSFRLSRNRLLEQVRNDVEKMTPHLKINDQRLRGIPNKAERLIKRGKIEKRKRELDAIKINLLKAGYCLQMESIAAPLCDSEDGQRLLRAEAGNEWIELALKIAPLEHEIKEHDQLSRQLTLIADIWRGASKSSDSQDMHP